MVDSNIEGTYELSEFVETPVLCIYYRGAYERIGAAISVLNDYVEENHIRTTGPYRSIYPKPSGLSSNTTAYSRHATI